MVTLTPLAAKILSPTPELQFHQADPDTRLVMVWVMAKQLHKAHKTTAPAAIFSQVVHRLVQEVHLVHREDRLEVLREIIAGANTRLGEAYSALDNNMRLAFWYRLVNGKSHRNLSNQLRQLGESRGMEEVLADLYQRDFNELVRLFNRTVGAD